MRWSIAKIKRYLELYATTGFLPSDLFQGEAAKVRNFSTLVCSVLFINLVEIPVKRPPFVMNVNP